MARYVLRRIGSALVILWVIISITFVLMHAIPGGPFTSEKKLPPQVKASIEAKYHLDDPYGSNMLIILVVLLQGI